MEPRTFNSIMPAVNHIWAAKVLNMTDNPHKGPDLIDNDKFVEIKFALSSNPKNYVKWTVLEHQMNYPENKKTPYWGLGTYQLKKPVSQINTKDLEKLEELVIQRNLYLVNWDWMNQFTPYHNCGQTHISSWNHSLRHPKFNKLPKVTKQFKVEKGKVYLTQRTQQKDFLLQYLS